MAVKDTVRQFVFFFSDRLATLGTKRKNSKTLLLVKTDAIGDYILFRNFIEIISNNSKYHDYTIVLCGNYIYKDLAEGLDKKWIDRFVWIDKKQMVRSVTYRFRKIREVSRIGASIAFNPVFSRDFFSGDSLIRASGAKVKTGCVADETIQKSGQLKVSNKYYTSLISGAEGTVFEFYRNKKVIEAFLSAPVLLEKPELPLRQFQDKVKFNLVDNVFLVINPSASSIDKRWAPSKFAELINRISALAEFNFVIVGAKSDSDLAAHIIKGAIHPERVHDLAGKTSLTELAVLISKARLVISNDTATVHFGAATGVPVVCISKGDHFGRFTEYPSACGDVTTIYPLEIRTHVGKKEILYDRYRYHSPLQIDSISVDDVFNVVWNKLAV